MNNFKGASLFNEIKDVKLRTWNRCAIIFNLTSTKGPDAASAYASKLDEASRKQVYGMFDCISKFGYDAVRKQLNDVALEA
jgi:hypothetical protein